MNVNLSKYQQQPKQAYTEEQRLLFQRTAIFDAARGRGEDRTGAYPILTNKQAEAHNVVDVVRQTLAIIQADHPGAVWTDKQFVATVKGMLEERVRLAIMASQPKEAPAKQIGTRFNKTRELDA